ncbi:MAG: M23 family metallopeptidase [Lachnospiraceae bacterium]|nr:M23 family metallopeptidase [Lachnospiraceae bacterium]
MKEGVILSGAKNLKKHKKKDKHRKKHKSTALQNTRAATDYIRRVQQTLLRAGENREGNATDYLITGVVPRALLSIGRLFARIALHIVRVVWKMLIALLPGILIVFAPFLIIIMIATAAGGVGEKASEELYREYVASATDAMPVDAVIAKDAQFVWPVSGRYYVTSVFGPRWGTFHGGIDLDARLNTPILAGADGTVRSAGYESSMGNYVIINHGMRNGQTVETVYMHNNRLAVSTGDTIKAGQVIAYAGETGEAFGVHCHFEVHINGNKVNPAPYLGLPAGVGEGDVTGLVEE